MNSKIHDFVAIGIGPFNLGLACLSQPLDGLDGVFLDQASGFDWHPGMLLENATLQTPFLADLVTLADPTSRFSFLNYLKHSGRIYAFYIREDFFMLRQEYNQYCQWVCAQLDSLRWQRRVERVEYDEINHLYQVHCHNLATGEAELYRGRHLVLGTGTVPLWPACCQSVQQQASHSASYLADKASLQRQPSITIVGSGQSAAEIYYDLLQDIDRYGYQLNWLTRSPRFFPLEYTKLTLELTSPEYVDYFHRLSLPQRDQLLQQQKGLFKGINASLINDIHELLYRKHLNGTPAPCCWPIPRSPLAGMTRPAGASCSACSSRNNSRTSSWRPPGWCWPPVMATASPPSWHRLPGASSAMPVAALPWRAITASMPTTACLCKTPNCTPTACRRRIWAWRAIAMPG
jgi:lysine N6-hydroxylase